MNEETGVPGDAASTRAGGDAREDAASPAARAGLDHVLAAERRVADLPEIRGIAPRRHERLGIVGGGEMGAGIATAALASGLVVVLVARDGDAARRTRRAVERALDAAIARGEVDAAAREAMLGPGLTTVTRYDALDDVDLVIETACEDADAKRRVFESLERVCVPGTILATDGAWSDLNGLAGTTSRPGDVVGLHFSPPADIAQLIEVVTAEHTVSDVVATAFALAKRLGKVAVRAGAGDGLIGERVFARHRAAADRVVLDGTSPDRVDRALEDFGFASGPYATCDPPRPVAEGAPGELDDDAIVRRCLAAMIDEGVRVVAEGVARRPLDVDVVLVNGFGFPRWRGGPLFHADAVGLDRVLDDLRTFAREDDRVWRASPSLERLVEQGRPLASLNEPAD